VKIAAYDGNIRADLERKGKTIGVNDLHITGHPLLIHTRVGLDSRFHENDDQ